MKSFRQISRPTFLLGSLLLSLALLCVQGAKLHVHNLDHGHDNHHTHTHAVDEASDHTHLSKAHFAHDRSHDDHHDGVVSEVDISPYRLLKNTNNNVVTVLFSLFFTLMTFASSRWLYQCYRKNKLIFHSCYPISPPLRAPPQN